jgi:hypothetical protein
MTIILATGEVEIRRAMVRGEGKRGGSKIPSQLTKSWAWWYTSATSAM